MNYRTKLFSLVLIMQAIVIAMTLVSAANAQPVTLEFQGSFGEPGNAPGQFSSPRGLAIDDQDRVIVVDSDNHRIQICDDQGSCSAFGELGTELGQFDSPNDVAIDSQGRIVIADTNNGRVQLCNDQGSCTAFAISSPIGVAIDAQDQIYVSGLSSFQVCDDQGNCDPFGSINTVTGVAFDSQGRIFVGNFFDDNIRVCDSMAQCVPFGEIGSAPGQFNLPLGIAVDSQDRIAVVDSGNQRIQVCEVVLDTDGAAQGDCAVIGEMGNGLEQFQAPADIAVDSADRIFVADSSNNRIQVIESLPGFVINNGIAGAWFDATTPGQGFLIEIEPVGQFIFIAWFTYEESTAKLGAPEQRWMTAQGNYSGNAAEIPVFVTSGGAFDNPQGVATEQDGSLSVSFSDCQTGQIEYNLTDDGLSGQIVINRLVPAAGALCESLATGK